MINKIHWYLGYNSLAMITDQERKHWLLKTDKKKTLIDPVTRDQFIGQIDNMGSDMIIETEKLSGKYSKLNNIQFDHHLNYIFELDPSAFPYTCAIGGVCFARITSTNYPTNVDVEEFSQDSALITEPRRKHYRIRFDDCQETIIPFAGSVSTEDVFATRWICSQQAFIELLDEETENYDSANAIPITFGDTSRSTEFYYPLTESLQTLPLSYDGNGSYHTAGITDDTLIGYPAFWMTDEVLSHGPWAAWDEMFAYNKRIWCFGTSGNGSIYVGNVYCGIDGNLDATPNDTPTDETYVYIKPDENIFTALFKNNITYNGNYAYVIKPDWIYIENDIQYFNITEPDMSKIYIVINDAWEFVQATNPGECDMIRIKMSEFDSNCMTRGMNPLKPIFRIYFNEAIKPYTEDTTDTGYTGIRMSSGNEYSDMNRRYPFNLNKWDGLPRWLQEMDEDRIKEFMTIYALHNTPNSDPEIPDSRQTAALLFDLGLEDKNEYDFYTKYIGTGYYLPSDDARTSGTNPITNLTNETIGDAFLEFTRSNNRTNFNNSKNAYGLSRYRKGIDHDPSEEIGKTDVEIHLLWGHPRTVEEFPVYTDWERATKVEWLKMTEAERSTFYPTYLEEFVPFFLKGHGYESYTEATEEELTYLGLPAGYTEEEYTRICTYFVGEAIAWWDEYLLNHEALYERIDQIYGVKILSHGDPETILNGDWLLNCLDEDGNYVCKIYSPKLEMDDRIGMDIAGMIKYFRICHWGYVNHQDVIENGSVTITTIVGAAEYGRGDHEHMVEYGISFILYPVSEITDVGRIYYLSNDEAKYENNRTSKYPKPDRTVARICDIPTSFVQLTGITGISPVSVVDPDYVRTDCNFSKLDKERLYNTYGTRWVRPDSEIIEGETEEDIQEIPKYVFESVDELNEKDLSDEMYHELLNIDERIDPVNDVEAGEITNAGLNYCYGDFGYLYVGGFAFQYNVLNVGDAGNITEFSISATKPGDTESTVYPKISLSNFDLIRNADGDIISDLTHEYGTAPKIGNGTGFKCTLRIPNIRDLIAQPGDLFKDLFALVKEEDGLYLYQYDTIQNAWKKDTQLAMFENKSLDGYHQTTTDSIISTMIPRYTDLMAHTYEDNQRPVYLNTLSTPSFVHIVDEQTTPIQTDDLIEHPDEALTEVDLCKLRCHSGVGQSNGFCIMDAGTRDFKSERAELNHIIKLLTDEDILQYDCYLAFKWVDEEDKGNTNFEYAIITRGFRNLITNNNFSMLPRNNLKFEKYVNSDANTTIVWDVPKIGPMMWVFNPKSNTHEKYHIDNERQSFYIERTPMTWDDIDIYSSSDDSVKSLFVLDDDKEEIIDYDIYTNSMFGYFNEEDSTSEKPYVDRSFRKLISRKTKKKNIVYQPTGNWTCVFPRVNSFIFQNDATNTRHIPIQMQVIHSTNINVNDRIYNEDTGYDESARTLILEDRGDTGVRFRAFNSETSTWDVVT